MFVLCLTFSTCIINKHFIPFVGLLFKYQIRFVSYVFYVRQCNVNLSNILITHASLGPKYNCNINENINKHFELPISRFL